ncbi:hypothetical protein Hokovirus_3_98 [Hokovirus HKV1]|uniref:Uncharacterized protein n=1 Tax=Hokovirus HKV1 TaxID=1977638 RepID=A0A1V0SGI0_9VIRU|nr:hypothetical protein Hokovirus_3_98 [Hokovirus HKV1]
MLTKKTYSFVTSNRNFDNQVFLNDKSTYYYQICTFPDPKTSRYHMRRFLFDGENNVSDITNYYLSQDQNALFYKTKTPNIYRAYPMNNFTNIDYPTEEDLDVARSELFGIKLNNTNYYNI